MLDLPPQVLENPKTEIEHIVATANPKSLGKPVYFSAKDASALEDPLYQKAQSMVATMNDGFQWQDIISLAQETFDFVNTHQGLSAAEQKNQVTTLLNYIIDLTDTPYLPDDFSDPVFKSLIPPIIDVIVNSAKLTIIPTITSGAPTQEMIKNFAQELQQTYSDGWQWSDLSSYTQSAINFVCSFTALSSQQKQAAVVDIINFAIDVIDIPYVPDDLVDPTLKAMVPPLVSMLFAKLGL